MLRAVIFDLDGTLVDSAPDLHAAACRLLEERGAKSLTLAQVHGFVGAGVPKLVERCLEASGLPAKGRPLADAVARFTEIYGAAPAELSRAHDGVDEALGSLSARGLLLGVCTNKPEGLTRQVLAGLALDRHIRVAVGGDTLAVMKPDARMLAHTADALGVGLDEVLFVGDSEIDAEMAAASKVRFALYSGGYRKRGLDMFEDCFVFHDYAALTHHALSLAR